MERRGGRGTLVIALALACGARGARAQAPGAGRGETYEPSPRTSRLGPAPGAGENPLGSSPGAGEAVLESRFGNPGLRVIPDPAPPPPRAEAVVAPLSASVRRASPYGSLAAEGAEEEGPPDGLTLDAAIERLVRRNLSLRSKAFEIPQAEADVLTAGLRANPLLYSDVQNVPYGSFSPRRPGGQTQYDLNVSYPLDLSRKRGARTLVARRAARVTQAQYQDAVRLELDNLYTEYVDALAARESLALARAGLAELEAGPKPRRAPAGRVATDAGRHAIKREAAEIDLLGAEEQYRAALRDLGALIGLRPAEAERLELRGALRDAAPEPAGGPELVRLALACRPDLAAHRLGVGRAESDVMLALANRYPDIYLLYQPYTFQDNSPLLARSSHSWGVGVSVPLPLFNRNQGNIERARLNVAQTRTELAALVEEVVVEVRQAERSYAVTRAAVRRIERSLLPAARRSHDEAVRLYLAGKADELTFLTAEQDFDQVSRQYRDTLVRHRRSMLRLDTAVGQRILP